MAFIWIDTKVSIDTFVQWRCPVSPGLIALVAGTFKRCRQFL